MLTSYFTDFMLTTTHERRPGVVLLFKELAELQMRLPIHRIARGTIRPGGNTENLILPRRPLLLLLGDRSSMMPSTQILRVDAQKELLARLLT